MVQARPRNEVNVIFHINRCGLCKRCISATAIFAVLLVTFILAQDDDAKLHYTSAFHVIDNTFTENLEVKEAKEEAEIQKDIIKETLVTTDNEDTSESNILEPQRFMAIAPTNMDTTLNLMSSSGESHIYTSSRSIEDIINEIGPQMDISKTSGISREDFIYALENCDADVAGNIGANAGFIWDQCQERNLNEFAIVGLIAIESRWANPEISKLAANKRNIMSVKNDDGVYKTYSKYSESIQDGIRLLAEKYVDENGKYATGGNLTTIGETYCPETPIWPFKVAECAEMATRALVKDKEEA